MRKLISPLMKFRPAFLPVIVAVLSLTLVSCEKETLDIPEENAELTIYDMLATDSGKKAKANAKGAPAPGDASIAEVALASEDFNELVAALVFTDLVDVFATGTDQLTVFAPTDAAFEELYAALGVESVTELPKDLVTNVLLYHVTEGRRASNSVVPRNNSRTIETLLTDATFSVNTTPEIIAVGSTANFLATDISASNGIIHVIDSVLLPINVE